jgi:hypothetical protein
MHITQMIQQLQDEIKEQQIKHQESLKEQQAGYFSALKVLYTVYSIVQ